MSKEARLLRLEATALAHPGVVDHLILVDAAGITPPMDLSDGLYFHLTPQRVVRLAGPLGPALVARARSEDAAQGPVPAASLAEYYYQLSAAPPSGETAFLNLITLRSWRRPLLDDLERLPMPVTLIWGAADELVKPKNARLAHARLPQSELVLLPGIGHIPQSEAPDAFHQAILDSRFR
ncbi:MAG TPA: alpha/beta fold hydrolase [Rhodothermales bacterium]|nr:alpha/beta fold hydrolase [Rhodothermales bacterium]